MDLLLLPTSCLVCNTSIVVQLHSTTHFLYDLQTYFVGWSHLLMCGVWRSPLISKLCFLYQHKVSMSNMMQYCDLKLNLQYNDSIFMANFLLQIPYDFGRYQKKYFLHLSLIFKIFTFFTHYSRDFSLLCRCNRMGVLWFTVLCSRDMTRYC